MTLKEVAVPTWRVTIRSPLRHEAEAALEATQGGPEIGQRPSSAVESSSESSSSPPEGQVDFGYSDDEGATEAAGGSTLLI